jgi:prevent-host-death family protein
MERSISATEANREFSRVLSEVSGGATYIVTSHGKPVAKMVPVTAEPADEAEKRRRLHALLDEMAKLPLVHAGRITRDDGYD